MTTKGHTPGPWQIGGALVSSRSGHSLAVMLRRPAVYGGKRHDTRDTDNFACEAGSEVDANARLIVAAPELLEAAKAALTTIEELPLDDESNYQCCGKRWSSALAYRGEESPHAADCIRNVLRSAITKAEGGTQ